MSGKRERTPEGEDRLLSTIADEALKLALDFLPIGTVIAIMSHLFRGDELIEMDLDEDGTFNQLCENAEDLSWVDQLNWLIIFLEAAMEGEDLSTKDKVIAFEDVRSGRKALREREEEEKQERIKKMKFGVELMEKAEKLYPGDPERDPAVKRAREKFFDEQMAK